MGKKITLILIVTILVMLLVCACQPKTEAPVKMDTTEETKTEEAAEEAPEEMPETITLTIATIYPPEQPASIAIEHAVKVIAEKSNGSIELIHYNSGQLGNNDELAQGLVNGSFDFNAQGLTFFRDLYPPVEVDTLFYAYRDWDHMYRVWDGEFGQNFNEGLVENTGTRIITPLVYGQRVFTTGDKPIRTPEDLEGLNIRCPNAKGYLDAITAMGANATPVAFNEVYLALSQGVVDGQENPVSVIMANKFDEVQNYMSLSYHHRNVIYFLANEEKWQSLTDEQRTVITEAFMEARELNDQIIAEQDVEGIEAFKASGGTVIEDVDRDAFQEKVLDFYKTSPEYEELYAMYEEIQAID